MLTSVFLQSVCAGSLAVKQFIGELNKSCASVGFDPEAQTE
jgi:hypothetical protein